MEANNSAPEVPAKPSIIRQLIPLVFAAGILVFMFYKVDFAKVWQVLKKAHSSWIIVAFLVNCLIYYSTDILSFWRAYNWFNTRSAWPRPRGSGWPPTRCRPSTARSPRSWACSICSG